MFKFLFNRKPKKVQVLVVANGDAFVPVDYSNKIDVSLETEVRAACNSLSILTEHGDIERIVDTLKRGESYWIDETWGFQVLEIEI